MRPPPHQQPPPGLSEDSKTHNSITISWNASTGANSYTVRLDGAQTPGVSGTSHTFTGLAPSTSYAIAVAAVNTVGSSSFTANLSVTTDAAPVTPPATPTGLQEVSKTDTTITVSMERGELTADSYTVRLNGTQTTGITGTTHQFTGLVAPSTDYRIGVRAVNTAGNSTFTTNIVITTDPTPTNPPPTPTGLTLVGRTSTTITVSWNPSAGATSYRVRLGSVQTPVPSGTMYMFTGLSPNITYQIAVAATNADGTSSFSANLSVTTDPVVPPMPTPAAEVKHTLSHVLASTTERVYFVPTGRVATVDVSVVSTATDGGVAIRWLDDDASATFELINDLRIGSATVQLLTGFILEEGDQLWAYKTGQGVITLTLTIDVK